MRTFLKVLVDGVCDDVKSSFEASYRGEYLGTTSLVQREGGELHMAKV